MTTAGLRWAPSVRKDLRALLPAWLATVAALLLLRRPAPQPHLDYVMVFIDLALASFFVGTSLVGALAIGHEYLYGTVGSLLAQPRGRRQIAFQKLAVLLPLEITLAILFGVRLTGLRVPILLWSVDVLPVVAAVTVAPWLTMRCRSALAGAVFTVTLLGLCFAAGALIGPALPFLLPDPGVMDVFVGCEVLLCVVGAVMSWRTFMQLEAVGGPGGESFVVDRRAPSAVVEEGRRTDTQSRIWLLVRKELRLQLPSLAVAVLYMLGCLALAIGDFDQRHVSSMLYGIAPLYIGLITLLIGAVSSAEERQLGTAEWQAMLPMSATAQWALKLLVTLAVLLVLAVVAPATILSVVPVTRILVTREAVIGGVLFTIPLLLIGMYISSLSRSSLMAFLAAAPTALTVWMGMAFYIRPTGSFGLASLARFGDGAWERFFSVVAPHGVSKAAQAMFAQWLPVAAATIAIAPLLASVYFAMRNHRSAERGARRVVKQIAWMVTFVAICTWASDGVAVGRYWDAPSARLAKTRESIQRVALDIDGHVGVCAQIGFSFRTGCVNSDELFPMGSNWRLPVVIAALKAIDSGSLKPDGSIDAWLDRALVDDDDASNLARVVSGTPVVDTFWFRDFTRGLLVRDGSSHLQDITTPAKFGLLLAEGGTPSGRLLSRGPTERLRDLITRAGSTGGGFKAGVPTGWMTWELATTTEGANGWPASSNDVGLLRAPDGTFITVAAFITNSHASAAERTAFFARIARAIVDAY